jgi:inner membrane protein
MDTITHVVLGACIGEVFVGKRIGKSSLLLGAVAQSVPDIDFVSSFYLSTTDNLLAHRGFTHSLLFMVLVVPLLAFVADRWRRPHDLAFRTWLLFFATEILTHLLLDTANAYGTGLLEPFSHLRFSYNTLFVADPFFSIVPGIVAVMLLINRTHAKRTVWAIVSIVWCSAYFLVGIANKMKVETSIKKSAAQQNIVYNRHFTTPTPFNNLLWYTVLESDSGYYVGYSSVFDKGRPVSFQYRNKNGFLLGKDTARDDIKNLKRFSQGYYTVEHFTDTLVFSDLRFGQVTGWNDSNARFAFYYFVDDAKANDLIIQRGRFSNWNATTVSSLWKRMMGN